MRLERSITVLAAAVLAGWLLAVLLCNGLFYRDIVNYEVLYQGMAGCWAKSSERGRTGQPSGIARFAGSSCIWHNALQDSEGRQSVPWYCRRFLRRSAFKPSGVEPRCVWRAVISGLWFSTGSGLSALFVSAADSWEIGPAGTERTPVLHHGLFAGGRNLDGALHQSADLKIVLKKYNAKLTTC